MKATESQKIYSKKWYKKNRQLALDRAKQWVIKNPEKALARGLNRYYKMSIQEYNDLLKIQDGVCAICKTKEQRRTRLSVDHCHSTGKIRGLLCNRCNRGGGFFEDSPILLRKAADYFENHGSI